MLTSRPMIVLASCMLVIGIIYATLLVDREATDSSLPVQALPPVSTDTETDSAGFLAGADVPDQSIGTVDDISAIRSSLVGNQNHDTPLNTIERTVDIGEDLDADDPDLNFDNSATAVNLGPDIDAYDTGTEVSYEPVEYVDIGADLDVDDTGVEASDEPVKYVDIGPDIDVADMYPSADYNSEYPQDIGPDMDADDFYQD